MAKVKKFAMGGMNLNRSSRRPPPAPPPPPRPLPSGSGLRGMAANMGIRPVPVASQVQNTSGAPAGLGAMGGGLSEAQVSGLRNNLGPQSAPPNAAGMMNAINTGMGARPSSVGGFNSPAGQPVQVQNTSGAPAGLGAMGGMKKGGSVKSSASKRGDGIAQRGKTRGKIV